MQTVRVEALVHYKASVVLVSRATPRRLLTLCAKGAGEITRSLHCLLGCYLFTPVTQEKLYNFEDGKGR